jgi:ArsR family transcriptional regulator, lead/cadmium/zinc/bismuth-responsive transcriptional repressor
MEKVDSRITNFFSALADETRLNILISLSKGSRTVNEIHKFVGKDITLSAISHQLKLLSSSDIVKHERKGREKHYSLSGDFCWCMLKDAMKHFSKKEVRRRR